jgi:hypothetical protein
MSLLDRQRKVFRLTADGHEKNLRTKQGVGGWVGGVETRWWRVSI